MIYVCLTLYMIKGYQVSFSVKTSQKSAFQNLKLARYFFLLPLKILRTRIFWRTLEVVTYARVLPWSNGLRCQCLKPKTWVQISTWPSLLSSQSYNESNILIWFPLRQNRFQYFLFDTRYDQRVSGFILTEDVPKNTFLTPWASALLFLGVRRTF